MKRYRFYNSRKFLNDNFYPRVEIKLKFAFFPTFVDQKWIWLKSYFSLYELSCFNFGGIDNISYVFIDKSLSIFRFKSYLRNEGILINLVKEKREYEEKLEASPDWWKQMVKGNFNE